MLYKQDDVAVNGVRFLKQMGWNYEKYVVANRMNLKMNKIKALPATGRAAKLSLSEHSGKCLLDICFYVVNMFNPYRKT